MAMRETDEVYYVCEDGSYGFGKVITFDVNDLTDDQYDKFIELDGDTYDYISAVMNGEPLDEWNEEEEEED